MGFARGQSRCTEQDVSTGNFSGAVQGGGRCAAAAGQTKVLEQTTRRGRAKGEERERFAGRGVWDGEAKKEDGRGREMGGEVTVFRATARARRTHASPSL